MTLVTYMKIWCNDWRFKSCSVVSRVKVSIQEQSFSLNLVSVILSKNFFRNGFVKFVRICLKSFAWFSKFCTLKTTNVSIYYLLIFKFNQFPLLSKIPPSTCIEITSIISIKINILRIFYDWKNLQNYVNNTSFGVQWFAYNEIRRNLKTALSFIS